MDHRAPAGAVLHRLHVLFLLAPAARRHDPSGPRQEPVLRGPGRPRRHHRLLQHQEHQVLPLVQPVGIPVVLRPAGPARHPCQPALPQGAQHQQRLPYPVRRRLPGPRLRGGQGGDGALPRLGDGRPQAGRAPRPVGPPLEEDHLSLRPVPGHLRDDHPGLQLLRPDHWPADVRDDPAGRRQPARHDHPGPRRGTGHRHHLRPLQRHQELGAPVVRPHRHRHRPRAPSATSSRTCPRTICTASSSKNTA